MNIIDSILYIGHFGYFFNYLVLFLVVFAESGLFVGVLLPGDSLLFTTGFLASENYVNIYLLLIIFTLAAVFGDSFGYYFGHKVGNKLFDKEDFRFFHKKNLVLAENYYASHRESVVILARFIPIIRTFAPIVAGMSNMRYSVFFGI